MYLRRNLALKWGDHAWEVDYWPRPELQLELEILAIESKVERKQSQKDKRKSMIEEIEANAESRVPRSG